MLLNGHTGNIGPLRSALWDLAGEGIIAATEQYFEIGGQNPPGLLRVDLDVNHGGEWEMALRFYLRPELVDMSKVVRDFRRPHLRDVHFAWINTPAKDSGIYDDATVATTETGKRALGVRTFRLAKFLRDWQSQEVPSDWRQ